MKMQRQYENSKLMPVFYIYMFQEYWILELFWQGWYFFVFTGIIDI